MENTRNILIRSDAQQAAPPARIVEAGSRRPLGAALEALKRMRGGQRVTCVARRVESGLSRTLAFKAARCYRAFGCALIAEHRPHLSVRA